MRRMKLFTIMLILALTVSACGKAENKEEKDPLKESAIVEINLSDEKITVDGDIVSENTKEAVFLANDIIYYEEGKDFTYGEGTEKDAHSLEEAAAHRVLHITKAGTYRLSGKFTQGQIAVDLGEDAKENPEAVVTLIMNGVDISCEVAPAVIFYSVYECGNTDTEKATKDVDTSLAGANVIIADDTENKIQGSYVERIYKPDSVVLNEDKTAVEDAKKLHKYDGAFYSKMSMNINGGEKNTGVLNIYAENEGLDSELHMTINGGNINIYSGNDGINTNEDGISVTSINGGVLKIQVTGETGEGDGIDSNGWLVINRGTVIAAACSNSADAGIDSDMGIHVNGGTVIATGHMLDRIEEGGQTYVVFQFAQKQDGKNIIRLKNQKGISCMEHSPGNAYSILIYSSPELKEGNYTLWNEEKQLAGQSNGMSGGMRPEGGMPGGMRPEGEMPEGMRPEEFREGEIPKLPEGQNPGFAGENPPALPEGEFPENGQEMPQDGRNPFEAGQYKGGEISTEFKMNPGANMFVNIS